MIRGSKDLLRQGGKDIQVRRDFAAGQIGKRSQSANREDKITKPINRGIHEVPGSLTKQGKHGSGPDVVVKNNRKGSGLTKNVGR